MSAKADAQKVAQAIRHRHHAEKVEQCRASGMKVVEWCKKEGISVTTLYRWQKETREAFLTTAEGQEMAAQLLPVSEMASSAASPQPRFDKMQAKTKTFGEKAQRNRVEAVITWRNSGQSASEWCREHGIAKSTFHQWQRVVRELEEYGELTGQCGDLSHARQPRFTELPALPPVVEESPYREPAPPEVAIRIQIGEMVIEIQKEADARLAESVVRALAKQC